MKFLIMRLVCLLSLAVATAFGQATAGQGALSGTVRDASGAAVPGARVVVSNESKGITRNLTSNDAGLFSAPGLAPAAGYSVIISKEGFQNFEAKEIQIEVGQNINVNATLGVASAATQVDVTSELPIVDTNKQGVSQVVNQKQIDELPINGRRVDSFVLLTPATTNDGAFGLISFRGIAGGNSFLTDGNDTTNVFYNENAGRTRISTQISQDAVQEFQVLSNGFSAEYGRAAGGVINTVTRSGTNDYHGTAYWLFRNRSLNAIDRYANGYNAPEVRHQAGATIGGPIKKDKLFFFLNGEVTDRNFPGVNRITTGFNNSSGNLAVGTPNSPGNGFCGAPATPAQCAAATQFVQTGNGVTVPRTAESQLIFGKLDWQPTDRDSFSFSMNYMRWESPFGIQTQAVLTNNNLVSNNANSAVRTRYGRASWTRVVTPTQVNEFRFGWFKDRLSDDSAPSLWPSTGPLGISVAGVPVGAATDYPRINPSEQRFQFVDNYSWTAGHHNLKFGVDISTNEDYLNLLRNQFGTYTYGNLQSFALDFSGNTFNAKNYNNFTQTFGNPILSFNMRDYNAYVQDSWKITPKFTWNWGLRYEYTQIDQPTQVNPNYPQTGTINQPNMNFAPRMSFSYALNEKTVIRSGFGIFYARFPASFIQTLYFNNGLYQPQVFVPRTDPGAPVFPNVLPSSEGVPGGSVSLTFADKGLRKPYVMQSDFSIERQLTSTMGLTLSYMYSRGVNFLTNRDLNAGPLSSDLVNYRINDLDGNQVGTYSTPVYRAASRIDPRFSQIYQVENGGQTWYNALAVQLNKRFSRGFQFSVAYTYSHAIDNFNQGGGSNQLFFDSVRSTYNGDYGLDKGSSSLDQRHRVNITSVWSPTFRGNGWARRYLLNGWSLSQITTLATPQPTTAFVTVSNSVPGLLRTTTLNGLGGNNRVPFLPVNSLDIDNVHRVDARLTKELPFTERIKLNLFFEAFNVFNTIYDTGVNAQAYTANYNATTRISTLTPNPNFGAGTASQGFPDGTNARRMQVGARFVF